MIETKDLGLLDEIEMLKRSGERSPYYIGQECKNYKRILETADLNRQGMTAIPELKKRLGDPDSAIRYWAIVGLTILGADDPETYTSFKNALADDSTSVRLAAADALCQLGHYEDAVEILAEIVEHPNVRTRSRAAYIVAIHGKKAHHIFQLILDPLKRSRVKEKDGMSG